MNYTQKFQISRIPISYEKKKLFLHGGVYDYALYVEGLVSFREMQRT